MIGTTPRPVALPPLPDLLPAHRFAALEQETAMPNGNGADSHADVTTLQPITVQPVTNLAILQFRSLRAGCYLLNYQPAGSPLVSFDGTLRVEAHADGRTASGDLYQRNLLYIPGSIFPFQPSQFVLGPAPNPANGIPILPRSRYRYYLRITQLLENYTFSDRFTLRFEMHRYTAPNSWVNEGTFSAEMVWTTAPAGYPSPSNYLVGDVRNAANAVVGRLTMGWVSSFLRRAVVEIDCVAGSEAPTASGLGHTWQNLFNAVGWQLTVQLSNNNVTQPSGESWSDAELHQAMLAWRAATNLDAEWRYHLFAVRRLDSTSRGIMYDVGATDSNNVPREGAALASHWTFPNADPWGLVKGVRFGAATAPYFRTAIHEIGHALGLYHNTINNGFMNTTDTIAFSATSSNPFPNNILWAFAANDAKALRHYPDIFVRPGGTAFGTASPNAPLITPTDLAVDIDELELRVAPVLEAVPLGAPVRVQIELLNVGERPEIVPESLSLKHGFVRGTVTDAAGNVRTFQPLIRCVEEHTLRVLKPEETIVDSLTLLRGAEGALFPAAGQHTVTVEVHWPVGDAEAVITGSTTVMVTPAMDEEHARAANRVLSSPDALLTLVLGGDHLAEGLEAFRAALSNATLRPHFAYLEAKRVAKQFGKRKPELQTAAELIAEEPVMSDAESRKASEIVDAASATYEPAKAIARALHKRVKPRGTGGRQPA